MSSDDIAKRMEMIEAMRKDATDRQQGTDTTTRVFMDETVGVFTSQDGERIKAPLMHPSDIMNAAIRATRSNDIPDYLRKELLKSNLRWQRGTPDNN